MVPEFLCDILEPFFVRICFYKIPACNFIRTRRKSCKPHLQLYSK